MDGHPQHPVGDGQSCRAEAVDTAICRHRHGVVRIVQAVVFQRLLLTDVIGRALVQVGQQHIACGIGRHGLSDASALVAHSKGHTFQSGGVQFIGDAQCDFGLLCVDLMQLRILAVLLLHLDIQIFLHGGVVVRCGLLLHGVIAQIQLLALAVAVLIADDGICILALRIAHRAVLGHDVLSRDDAECTAAHRQLRLGVVHLDTNDVFAGRQPDLHHIGVGPVVHPVYIIIGVPRRIVALRLGQLVEIVTALPDLFRQIKDAFLGRLIVAVVDFFRIIGIQGLQASVLQMGRIGAVQLEGNARFRDAPLRLIIDHFYEHGGLNAVLAVAASTAGLDDLLVELTVAVSITIAGAAVIVPAAGVVIVPAGAAGRRPFAGNGGRLLITGVVAQKIETQQRNDEHQHKHKAAHHIGGRLPEVVLLIRFLSVSFHPACPTFRILANSSTDSGREKK